MPDFAVRRDCPFPEGDQPTPNSHWMLCFGDARISVASRMDVEEVEHAVSLAYRNGTPHLFIVFRDLCGAENRFMASRYVGAWEWTQEAVNRNDWYERECEEARPYKADLDPE